MKASATLADWLGYLERIHPTEMDLGLARVRTVWNRLGSPRPARHVITVAGTNGKGSTVAALDALLRAHGWHSGTTTSPHLVRFNERITVGGETVSDASIIEAFERIEAARADVSLTYFEFAMLAAIDIMARAGLDAAVLEVGLGGRLDAANVIDADIAVITAIALDHEAWLGTDREAIGREKAGILRQGCPLVIGETDPPASVLAAAAALAAKVHRRGGGFDLTPDPAGRWAFHGGADGDVRLDDLPEPRLHPDAIAAALEVLTLLPVALSAARVHHALVDLTLPGRMQRATAGGVELILDVAHNPHAVAALVARLLPGTRYVAVLGTFRDKRVEIMAELLATKVTELFLAPTPGPRGQSAEDLADRLAVVLPDTVLRPCDSVAAALSVAAAQARKVGATILVLGSFTMIAAAHRWLADERQAG